ncbi:GNAT family N-acetyltransferase [Desulfitobacterium sp.]|uniref:GNAT family N-acetyltransferase n=1 Tax=Desulfitobacterium sp. TaxID=49981 RepID=UPI002B68A76A|nr:GNAT family N-acetyltransferase [Desulfitobacterium sp.]HVJ49655.1 GNAT family N-acetyltransferase [Desulfitobacterium sp.]
MNEIRLAQKDEIVRQKEIWKRCFGDDDCYIDFYYANKYKENETVVLLEDGEIAAMLTMIPTRIVTSDQRSFAAAMFYAIATHPKYQNKGLAKQLMDFCHAYLGATQKDFSLLVPAGKSLFDFYRKQGYQEGFYLREVLLTRERIDDLATSECPPIISSLTPTEYNQRRDNQLKRGLHIAYADEEIAYQKKLSQLSGADIYALDNQEIKGCAVIERMTLEKVLIKEILLPGELIQSALRQIAKLLPAKEYVLRTPADQGENWGGSIRPFGMVRKQSKPDIKITSKEQGYLGLAFD